MSNELASDVAIRRKAECFGVDGVGYDETETEPPTSGAKFDRPAVKIMFQVTRIVRFLLEGGLRFRNNSAIYPEGLAFYLPFLEGHGWCICL